MHPHRYAIIVILTTLCLACATAPHQAGLPESIRKNTYYTNKGTALFNKGCHQSALDYFQSVHQRYTAADNQEKVAETLTGIGDIYYRLGDMPSALRVYDDAIEVYQNLADDTGTVRALSNKAAALIALDRLDDAAAVLDRADALGQERTQAALRLKTRALLLIRQNRMEPARALLDQALASVTTDEESLRSSVYFALGHIALLDNRPGPAKDQYNEALRIDRATGAYHDTARDLEAIGTCHARLGNYRAAVHYFKRSAKIFALLHENQRAESALAQLETSAAHTDIDIQATVYWVRQWLGDPNGADLCQ